MEDNKRLPFTCYDYDHYMITLPPLKLFFCLVSRARPTLNLPCISPQNSVTCNGEYRRPVIKAQPSFYGDGVIFSIACVAGGMVNAK